MRIPLWKPSIRLYRPLVLTCFFISGACGLIYQVAWLRVMGLVFGNTTFAASTVLAGYMAGLGLGALHFGRRIDRGGDPIGVYGLLELGIGGYALLTPLLWKIIEAGSAGFYRLVQPDFFTLSLFRFAVAFLVLFPPTFLMGGTLPVITKAFVKNEAETARGVGLLYALNTLGAVLGTFLCGFYLLYWFGVWQTTVATGLLNMLIFYACGCLAQGCPWTRPPVPAARPFQSPARLSAPRRFLLFLFGVSGAVSMVYEIGWTRVLAVALGSSVYAFSIMLATFLLGIALGSYALSLYARRFGAGLRLFAALELFTALGVFLGLNQFDKLSYAFVQVYEWAQGSTGLLDLGRFLLCARVMLPPTFCIGALFACFMHVYRQQEGLGGEVGRAYFANTVGTIAGSVLTGFWLIPAFGIQRSLMGAASLNALIGLAAFGLYPRSLNIKKIAAGGFLLAGVISSGVCVQPWNKSILTSDTAINPSRVKGLSAGEFVRSMRERQLVYYKEGLSANVSVIRLRDDLSLAVNGKTDASTKDAFTQFLLGHLPLLLNPDAKDVLVIGLGSGSTLAAVAAHPVRQIDAVELEPAVVEGTRLFKKLNRDVLKDPRVHLIFNDGRNQVLLSPKKYDVMISEPSNPWIAGVANLFSKEHYQNMRGRLNAGGVVCQWLHAYSMSSEDLRMIIATFADVFPHASLWTSYYPDIMLIGTQEPLALDFKKISAAFSRGQTARDLGVHGIKTPEAFMANYWLGENEIRRLAKGAVLNTDNHPRLEFSAPRHLYESTLVPNFQLLNSVRANGLPHIQNLQPPAGNNAGFLRELGAGYKAKRFMREAHSALARAHEIDPLSRQTLLADAIFYFENEKLSEAEALFKKVLASQPEFAQAHDYLGLIAEKRSDASAARAQLEQAVQLEPENAAYLKDLFHLYHVAGDYDRALRVYQAILKMGEEEFTIMAPMAVLAFQKAPPEKQAAFAREMIERYPRFALAYARLGQLYEAAGALPFARAVYQLMERELPLEPDTYLQLARIYQRTGETAAFKQAMHKAIQLSPGLKTNPEVVKALASVK